MKLSGPTKHLPQGYYLIPLGDIQQIFVKSSFLLGPIPGNGDRGESEMDKLTPLKDLIL